MRVTLFIRDLGYAGAQRQLVALAAGLKARHGATVTVITFYGGPMTAELCAAGNEVVNLEKRGRWDMAGFIWRLVRAVRESNPDVLYSFLTESNLLAALIKPLLPGARLVWGLRDSESDAALYGMLGRAAFALSRWLSRVPHLIIANSHSGARYYVQQGYPGRSIVVVPNGIDTARFRPDAIARQRVRTEWNVKPDDTLFAIIGRLSPMKDYETFLRAAASVADPRARFVCVGGGDDDYAARMRALARTLGIESRVQWSAPRDDMPAVFAAADALVSASAFGEGFSNVTGEAMACATPCIVTDVGDSALLVGAAGVSVPRKDPEALGAAMNRFLQLPVSERGMLAEAARHRIEENFSLDRMVDATADRLGLRAEPAHADESVVRPLFLITALGSGGAEMMLTQIVTHLDRKRFAPAVVSLMPGGKHAATLREAGIPVHDLGLAAGRPTLASIWRLRRLVKAVRPDVLVGWMYHGNLAASLASWLGCRVPVIWNVRQSLYSLDFEKRGSAFVIKLLARLRFNPAAVLYNSRVSARQHEALGYPAAKTVLVPNGFDCARFAPDADARAAVRSELGLPLDALLVGRFGRNTAMKDFATFAQAAEILHARRTDICFVVAGAGTESLPPSPGLRILGERHDLPRLTAALDVACSSSAFGEGFPNVVAESMSCAVPCVVTDVGDSAWLLGSAGKVVPPGDPRSLAAAIESLIALPPEGRRSIGHQGRQRILQDFALPAVVARFESLIHPAHRGSPPSAIAPHSDPTLNNPKSTCVA